MPPQMHGISASRFRGKKRDKKEEHEWEPVDGPSNRETLMTMLLDLYWNGVYREVKHILLSLISLQNHAPSQVEEERERNGDVVGYHAFIEQICAQPEEYVEDEKNLQRQWEQGPHQPVHPMKTRAPKTGEFLRSLVEARLRETSPASLPSDKALKYSSQCYKSRLYFRARCLLQAAGFLDIDKLVEYRKPVEKFNVWKKGKVPQLKVDHFDPSGIPIILPARCGICQDILRGILFRCDIKDCREEPPLKPQDYICEDCFHNERHNQKHLVKYYKHCILDDVITPQISQRLCRCSTVSRFDLDGGNAKLYPIDPLAKHRQAADGYSKCPLFLLPGLVVEQKYQGLETSMESRKGKGNGPIGGNPRERRERHANAVISGGMYALGAKLDDTLDTDIPLPLRGYASKFPFGNTHIALMVGPLIIENGLAQGQPDVQISMRDSFNYFFPVDSDEELPRCVALNERRDLFTSYRLPRKPRRLKACMKQVVGSAFSGYFNSRFEDEIIHDLIAFSTFKKKSTPHNMFKIHEGTKAITDKLKLLLSSRIVIYLEKIVAQLYNPAVPLKWDALNNNCQCFIDAILRHEDFGALFGEGRGPLGTPLYLMSFVVRIESYQMARIKTKHDVPNGLTEEYLLAFHSGRHDDADIIDTLQEYWFDWGTFGHQLYRYQDVFPWDCTEAYKKEPPTCNNCTLSQHAWAFPFDSWSFIQHGLQKDQGWYAGKQGRARLTPEEWLNNRFTLFIARDALIRGAVGMAKTHELRMACDWLRTSPEAQFDRLKLGGIHRAQPWSHHFEAGRYRQLLIAPWAKYTYEVRVLAYEALREMRKRMANPEPDVDLPDQPISRVDWIIKIAEEITPALATNVTYEAFALHHQVFIETASSSIDPSSLTHAAASAANIAASAEPLHDSLHHVANILGAFG